MQIIMKKCRKNGNRVWSMFLAFAMVISLFSGLSLMEVKAEEKEPILFSSIQPGKILYPGDRIQLPAHPDCTTNTACMIFSSTTYWSCKDIYEVPENSIGKRGWEVRTCSNMGSMAMDCCVLQGIEIEIETYTATVTNGTGSGKYGKDDKVTIIADTAPEGMRFKEWKSADDVTFEDSKSATTTFTMPEKAVTVTATYEDIPPVYTATVTNGTGGGEYEKGAAVTITADAAPEGKQFKEWTSTDGVIFADSKSATTTFAMPEKAVTVVATYEDIPPVPATKYTATVTNGTGGGEYAKDETVTITANAAPEGKQFKEWTSTDGVIFADSKSATTTFAMPEKAVNVTAIYENSSTTGTADNTKTTAVNTGDTMNTLVWVMLLLGASVILGVVLTKRSRRHV